MNPKFKVELLKEVNEFLNQPDEKAKRKIVYNMRKAQVANDSELFKKLNSNVWEFRTLHNKTYYRLFAFWDKTGKTETVVVSTHGKENRKNTSKGNRKDRADYERIFCR